MVGELPSTLRSSLRRLTRVFAAARWPGSPLINYYNLRFPQLHQKASSNLRRHLDVEYSQFVNVCTIGLICQKELTVHFKNCCLVAKFQRK